MSFLSDTRIWLLVLGHIEKGHPDIVVSHIFMSDTAKKEQATPKIVSVVVLTVHVIQIIEQRHCFCLVKLLSRVM
jgi:hypothetical protein